MMEGVRKRIVIAVALAVLMAAPTCAKINFFALVETGTAQQIRAAIDAGAEVNARSDSNNTPLLVAAGFNPNPEVITTLLKASIDLMAQEETNGGMTALIAAASNNQNPEVTAILLKAGADVNAQNKDGLTALMWAGQFNENP